MKTLLVILSLIINNIIAFCQTSETVKVSPYCEAKVKFNFTEDWQYLSTDLYFFNGQNTNNLLDILWQNDKKKRKTIQSVLITSKLNDKPFNGITYPLYNFICDKDAKLNIINTKEKISIIDNLPISLLENDKIDSEISMHVVTQENRNQIFEFALKQLKDFPKLTTPLSAAKTLVSELGNFISSRDAGKEYVFNSTIMLYEGENSEYKKIHSAYAYIFYPSNIEKPICDEKTSLKFKNYIENAEKINFDTLSKIFDYNFPYIVSVNYKSQYVSPKINFDKISEKEIFKRELAIEDMNLSENIVKNESKLNKYLNYYLQISSLAKKFSSNYNNSNKNTKTNMAVEALNTFLNIKKNSQKQPSDPIFKTCFIKQYNNVDNEIVKNINTDNDLKHIYYISQLIEKYNNNLPEDNDYETDLETIYTYFPPENSTPNSIKKLTEKIEQKIFELDFAENLKTLDQENNALVYQEIISDTTHTSCISCKTKAKEIIENYEVNNRIKNYNEPIKTTAINPNYNAYYSDEQLEENIIKNYNTLIKKAFSTTKSVETLDENYEKYKNTLPQQSINQTHNIITDIKFYNQELKGYLSNITEENQNKETDTDLLEERSKILTQKIEKIENLKQNLYTIMPIIDVEN